MARPLAKIEYKVGSGDSTKRYEIGVVWPGREKAGGGNWPPSLQIVTESDLDHQFPKMAFAEAMAKVDAKEGFMNFTTPKGFELKLVPVVDEDDFQQLAEHVVETCAVLIQTVPRKRTTVNDLTARKDQRLWRVPNRWGVGTLRSTRRFNS